MNMPYLQRTLAGTATCEGIGLHSGKNVTLTIKPAPVNHGIKFKRVDLPDQPCIAARFNKVVDTSLATVIGADGCIVATIEHLMAALSGLAIDNALIETDAYELPIMDGSAAPFSHLIQSAGVEIQEMPRYYFVIEKPIELSQEDKFVGIYPAAHLRITCTIDYANPIIGSQTIDSVITPEYFAREIAPARTFGFLHEVEHMQKYGLARGGSLANAIVIGQDCIVNEESLRFDDEFVRHKLLDCVGDFSLLGLPLLGHIKVERSGHNFNHAFLEKFFNSKDAWQTRTIETSHSGSPAYATAFAN